MGYAPGVEGSTDERERRFRHQAQRQTNVSDLILGLGMVAQQLGQARRSQQTEADTAVEAQRLGEIQAHPEGAPGEMGPGGMGPATAPVPWEQRLGEEAGGYRPSTALENLGRSFTEPTGIQQTQGRLKPDAAMRLMGAAQGQRATQAAIAHQQRMEAFEARKVGALEETARARTTAAGRGGGALTDNNRERLKRADENRLAKINADLAYYEDTGQKGQQAMTAYRSTHALASQEDLQAEKSQILARLQKVSPEGEAAISDFIGKYRGASHNLPARPQPAPAAAPAASADEFQAQYLQEHGGPDSMSDDDWNELTDILMEQYGVDVGG